jgi:uncharacterized protein YaaN involved in tellurite resistance|tara:strand:- start:282 stop:515 length:234 start_codon:yes stop_codon:yes gene_type:complete
MKVKHLKTKTTIELTPEELEKYRKLTNDLDSMLSSLFECQDIWLSDVRNLDTLKWRLTELLGLQWNREKYSYIKKGQ